MFLHLFVMSKKFFKSDTMDVCITFCAKDLMMCNICHQMLWKGLYWTYWVHDCSTFTFQLRKWCLVCSFTVLSPSRTQKLCLWVWIPTCPYKRCHFFCQNFLLSRIGEAKCERLVSGCRRLIAKGVVHCYSTAEMKPDLFNILWEALP